MSVVKQIILLMVAGLSSQAYSASIHKPNHEDIFAFGPRINRFPQQSVATKPEPNEYIFETLYFQQVVSTALNSLHT